MEKEFLKNSKDIVRNSNDSYVIESGKTLSKLLEMGGLTKDIIENKAKEINSDAHILFLTILGFCDLDEEYLIYKKDKEGLSNIREIDFSFLEQIQKQSKVSQPTPEVAEPIKPEPIVIPEEELAMKFQPIEATSTQEPIPSIKTNESISKPEKKNWQEVERKTEVMAVEDLDGDMRTFEKNVEALGVAKKDGKGHWQWTGGNKKLVFLGDILGDRQMDGMAITNIVFDLADQAKKQGGQVDFLCGNHDMSFIRFLCRNADDKYARRNADLFTSQAKGIWELTKFDQSVGSKLKKTSPFEDKFSDNEEELWGELYDKMPDILNNMKNSPEGKKILENICKIKAAVIHDDTLFCHTDPTIRMVTDLTVDNNIAQRVEELNNIFQENLRKIIFSGEKPSAEFEKIAEIYFSAKNREYFVERDSYEKLAENILAKDNNKKKYFSLSERNDAIELLTNELEKANPVITNINKTRESGINAIIHGHSPRNDGRYYDENGLIIVSPHAYFVEGANADKGVCTIRRDGEIDFIGKSFRENKPQYLPRKNKKQD